MGPLGTGASRKSRRMEIASTVAPVSSGGPLFNFPDRKFYCMTAIWSCTKFFGRSGLGGRWNPPHRDSCPFQLGPIPGQTPRSIECSSRGIITPLAPSGRRELGKGMGVGRSKIQPDPQGGSLFDFLGSKFDPRKRRRFGLFLLWEIIHI